jgi:hypothetical protein
MTTDRQRKLFFLPHATRCVPDIIHSSTILDDRRLETHFFGEVRGIDLCQNEKRTTGKKKKDSFGPSQFHDINYH